MGQPTQRFKKSVSGSIGSGMKSVIGGEGRRFYVLEHKVSSKYHKAGEEQKIIVDQIEIGRGSQCAVRLEGNDPNDKMFQIVSRKHAAIERDGDNWTLVHLSATNSTFLNGRKLSTPGQKWYLQNGDEIQIAESGPKLGFKIPQGEKGLVKSLRMTDRLNLFRQQALRPYKQGMVALSCALILCIGLGAYIIKDLSTDLDRYKTENIAMADEFKQKMNEKAIADSIQRVEDEERHKKKLQELDVKRKEEIEKIRKDFENKIKISKGIDALIEEQNIEKDVYFLYTEKVCYVDENGKETVLPDYGWSGTGFLLNDGKFVTARHCVEGWLYSDPLSETVAADYVRKSINTKGTKIKAYLKAISSLARKELSFTSDQFSMDHDLDQVASIGNDDEGRPIKWIFTFPAMKGMEEKMWSTDWASIKTTARGAIQASSSLSKKLVTQQPLIVLGFPVNLGVADGAEMIQPISSEVHVSRGGLANNGCILHSSGTDHGNSGGPIFALENERLVVVGIVSRGDMRTKQHNWAVPICNVK